MRLYIIMLVILFILDVLVKLYMLGTGDITPRTPITVAFNAGANILLAVLGILVVLNSDR